MKYRDPALPVAASFLVIVLISGSAPADMNDASLDDASESKSVRPVVIEHAAPVAITDVQVGFQGRYKVGHWFPVTVTLQAADQPVSGRLSITVPDGMGAACQYVQTGESEIQIAAGQSVDAMVYVRSGRVRGSLQVTFTLQDGRVICRTLDRNELQAAILTSQRLIVSVGTPIGCRNAAARHPQPKDDRLIVAQVQDIRLLPNQSCGYGGVDVMVLTTHELERLQLLSKTQWQAIDQWVRLGGRLILTVGAHGDELLATGRPLEGLLPGTFSRVSNLRETGGLESYAKSSQRLDLLFREENTEEVALQAALLEPVDGVVEVFEGQGDNRIPLVVHGAHGFGRVIFVAIDLDRPPVDRWEGRVSLVSRLLELALGPLLDSDDEGPRIRGAHVGYEDLTGQVRMALDQFRGVRRLPFMAIAALATLYILLIGPGDYFFVRRVLRRVQATWITFPLLVLLFGGAAIALTWQPGTGPCQINQLEIIDLDAETGTYRGSTWSHVFSRNAAQWDLGLQIEENIVANADEGQGRGGKLVSWQGLPGTGFGGMNDLQRNANAWQEYSIVGRGFDTHRRIDTRIENLPMSKGSTRSLFGRWWRFGSGTTDRSLEEHADETVSGTVINPWKVAVQDAWLVHGRWYYPLGTLAPGQQIEITANTDPHSLKSLLARRKIIDGKDVSTPWNKESTDLPRLVEMMMFHEAAGGRNYTSLRHRHQQELDLSTQVKMGRAVLVGQVAEQVAQWTCQPSTEGAANDSSRSALALDEDPGRADPASANLSCSFVRVLLPVNRYQRHQTP